MNGSAQSFIWRERDATRINQVLNHPDVHPWVTDDDKPLDVSAGVANPNNVLLMGEWGGCLCIQMLDGVYEVHTQILPEGRGKWALDFVRAGSAYMFLKTNAYEIVTRVAEGNVAAKALTLAAGMRFDFRRTEGKTVDLYSFRIQDWVLLGRGLEEVGAAFHAALTAEMERIGVEVEPHEPDPNHNRFVGAAYTLITSGFAAKGVTLYNRWAFMTRHPFISIVQHEPLTIKIDVGLLRLGEHGMELSLC